MKERFLLLLFFLVCVFLSSGTLWAAEKPYYQGKTIEILGESRVGGGTDTMARIIASVLPKYIPGKPKVVVRAMPGGAGSIANNIFYDKGNPDGLHLLMNSSSPISLQLRGREIVKYNLLDYKHIANVARGGNIIIIRKGALKRLYDPKREPVICGTKEGEETWNGILIWGKEFLGWNVRWVPGYSGTSDIELAFRRGEVDVFGTSNAFIINRLREEGLAVPITQGGSFKGGKFSRRPDFPDVPTFVETLGDKKPTGVPWKAYLVWMGPKLVDKFLVAPRNTPDRYVSVLVDAFAKMAKDPKFDQLVKKMVSAVYEVNVGAETTNILRNILDVPKEVLEYSRGLQRKFGIISG